MPKFYTSLCFTNENRWKEILSTNGAIEVSVCNKHIIVLLLSGTLTFTQGTHKQLVFCTNSEKKTITLPLSLHTCITCWQFWVLYKSWRGVTSFLIVELVKTKLPSPEYGSLGHHHIFREDGHELLSCDRKSVNKDNELKCVVFLSKLLSIGIFSELQKHFLCVQQYTYWSLTEQFRIQFCTRMSWYRLSNATGSRIIIFGKR